MNLTLGDIATLLSVGALLFGGALGFIMSKAGNTFAAKNSVAAIEKRMHEIEAQLARTVKHDEMGEVFDRLRAVETGVAVGNEALTGVRGSLGRIEHQLQLIVQAQLNTEKAAEPKRRTGGSA